jgi:hypothetical protein
MVGKQKSVVPPVVAAAIQMRVHALRDNRSRLEMQMEYAKTNLATVSTEIAALEAHAKSAGIDLSNYIGYGIGKAETVAPTLGDVAQGAQGPGDALPKTGANAGKKQSAEQVAKRIAKMKATMAAKKAAKEGAKSGTVEASVPVTGNPELDQVLAATAAE